MKTILSFLLFFSSAHACWFACEECPDPAPFNVALLAREMLSYDKAVLTCCLDNGSCRPVYLFKFENFPARTVIKCPKVDFFAYDKDYVEVDSQGYALVVAYVVFGKEVPEILSLSFAIEEERVPIRANTTREE